jgi:hypothetical protein
VALSRIVLDDAGTLPCHGFIPSTLYISWRRSGPEGHCRRSSRTTPEWANPQRISACPPSARHDRHFKVTSVVILAQHGGGRTPHVVGDLLDSAIATNDADANEAVFDGVAFYHANGALALMMLERAYIAGGRRSKAGS